MKYRFQKILEGLTILSKYISATNGYVSFEDDGMQVGPDSSVQISQEDLKTLTELGWFQDEELDCWAF